MTIRGSIPVALAGALLSLVSCNVEPAVQQVAVGPTNFDVNAAPAEFIGEYNLFKDAQHHVPNEGVVPYDLNSPLFTDYATKHRFVWLPSGAKATYSETNSFDFPIGTVIVKSFGYLNDIRDPSKGERLIETRLLVHKPSGWVGLPYIWNDDASAARLALVGARIPVKWTHYDGNEQTLNYVIPNVNQCKQCHENEGKMGPLGPKARQLNGDFHYPEGVENQLTHWTKVGILDGAPADSEAAPRLARWNDPNTGTVEERARAYMDINCAHCHNPKGTAYTSGLDLSYDQLEPVRYGVFKTPVAAGRGSMGSRFSIHPGNPDDSFLIHRMASTDPGIMMPVLGRQMVHDEAIALIREWISQMKVDAAVQPASTSGAAQSSARLESETPAAPTAF